MLKDSTLEKHTSVVGSYRLGCHPSVGLYSLKYFVADLVKKYPKLELSIIHDHSKGITQKVIDLEVDIALAVNPIRHPDLIIKKIFTDEVSLWRSSKCVDSEVLICDPSLVQSTTIMKKLKKNAVNFRRVISSSSLENIVNLCESGAGIGIIPGRVVKESNARTLSKVIDTPVFKDEICLIYRFENKNIMAIDTIAKAIFESLA